MSSSNMITFLRSQSRARTRDPSTLTTYLSGYAAHLLPHEAREYVFQKREIDVRFDDFELGLAGVQGEGGGGGFAGFDGAGEEVEGEELHFGGGSIFSSSSLLCWRTRVGTGIEVARGGGGWVGCDVMWWDDGWAVGWVQYKFLVG